MQTVGVEGAVHYRAIEPDQAVCSRAAQVDRAFDPAVDDRDCSNELRVFEIDIPDNPGACDPHARERHMLSPRRLRQQVHQKAGRELAAVVSPALVFVLFGI
ncbi:MAG: hypothetical protein WA553_04120 [Methylocella sp.]